MTMYAMASRTLGAVIIKKSANNLNETIDIFAQMKQLPKEDFLKIFTVTEVNDERLSEGTTYINAY